MANAVFEAGKAGLGLARKITLSLLEDFDGDGWVHRPFSGANHALWTVGHIAWADDEFLEKLKGRAPSLPKEWWGLFGMGSTPTADRDAYPEANVLMEAMAAHREELLSWFASLDGTQLAAPSPDAWKTFGPNYGSLMSSIAWHEGFHAGQLSMIRKSLDLPRKFG